MRKGFRWLLAALGILVLVTLIGWTAWNAMAGARLRAALKEVAARGLPTCIEDIRPDPVPDGENAALLLNRAFLLMARGKTDPGAQLAVLAELGSFWKKDPC